MILRDLGDHMYHWLWTSCQRCGRQMGAMRVLATGLAHWVGMGCCLLMPIMVLGHHSASRGDDGPVSHHGAKLARGLQYHVYVTTRRIAANTRTQTMATKITQEPAGAYNWYVLRVNKGNGLEFESQWTDKDLAESEAAYWATQ